MTILLVGAWVVSFAAEEAKRKNEELENNLLLWKLNKPTYYRFVYSAGCMWATKHKVEIDKFGIKITPLNDSSALKPFQMDSLFEHVRDANLTAHQVETEYHPYFGFPVTISVDWEKDVIDDECFIQVSDFEVVSGKET